jgi:hypothetical protein
MHSVHYYKSYIKFTLCYAYVVNLVNLTPMLFEYSRLCGLRSVRHPSFVAYQWVRLRATYTIGLISRVTGKFNPRVKSVRLISHGFFCLLHTQA